MLNSPCRILLFLISKTNEKNIFSTNLQIQTFENLIQQTFQHSCKVKVKLSIQKKLTKIIFYSKTEIYNADEFGHALPKKALHTKDEKCTGGKHSKIRMTGLTAAYMNGDELPLLVIGKLNNLWCFKQFRKLICRCPSRNKS